VTGSEQSSIDENEPPPEALTTPRGERSPWRHTPQPDSVDLRRNGTVQATNESKHTAKSERKLGSLRIHSEGLDRTPDAGKQFFVDSFG
jgi:hypothetical protein